MRRLYVRHPAAFDSAYEGIDLEGHLPQREPGHVAAPSMTCWLCGSADSRLVRPSTLGQTLSQANFQITDAHYSETLAIYRCERCGFLFCGDTVDPLPFYEAMADEGYEETRAPRLLQAERLLRLVPAGAPGRRLLDVGAGSGILIEAANTLGFDAEGIEPSAWLQHQAAARGLRVHPGVLPDPAVAGPYEIVTVIDVIEHVRDPVGLLKQVREVMAEGGVGLVVTPDVGSLAARLMRWRWWHFRVAHIGYFNRKTLRDAFAAAGLSVRAIKRPTWYFPADYLLTRLAVYFPFLARLPVPQAIRRLVVPLNLFDSLLVVFEKR